MKILVTTNLKETYGKEEEILFAGDWVKSSLSFEKDFKKRKYKFFESIWKDKKDIKKFIPYLTELENKLVNRLSSDLNVLHNIDYPLRSWKIIINPWLHFYLEGMYTRFETINTILNKREHLICCNPPMISISIEKSTVIINYLIFRACKITNIPQSVTKTKTISMSLSVEFQRTPPC